jgi:hypothetical protein
MSECAVTVLPSGDGTGGKRMKPKLSLAAAQAYSKVSALPDNTPVKVDGQQALFLGMTGYLVTLKHGSKTIYLRQGDPIIEEIEV